MNRSASTDFIVYSFVVAGILVMTRPGSQGPALLGGLFSGYTKVVQGSSGQTVTG